MKPSASISVTLPLEAPLASNDSIFEGDDGSKGDDGSALYTAAILSSSIKMCLFEKVPSLCGTSPFLINSRILARQGQPGIEIRLFMETHKVRVIAFFQGDEI